MDMPLSERRLIENEMIFRQENEKISDGLDDLDAMHIEDGNPQLTRDNDLVLHFWCECSDENCKARIAMKHETYQEIHENRSAFVVKPDHQVHEIEKVISTSDKYIVVEKNKTTPEPGGTLNKTEIENT